MKAARRRRKTLVFIVNFWKRGAIQLLPCRLPLHSAAGTEGESCTVCRAPSGSNMAQHQVMLMCYYTVAIRTSSPWTLPQHLGLPEEPASHIPPASQAAVGGKRKRGALLRRWGAVLCSERLPGSAAPCWRRSGSDVSCEACCLDATSLPVPQKKAASNVL